MKKIFLCQNFIVLIFFKMIFLYLELSKEAQDLKNKNNKSGYEAYLNLWQLVISRWECSFCIVYT